MSEHEILLHREPPTPHHCVIESNGRDPECWELTCAVCGHVSDGWTTRQHARDAATAHNAKERWVDDDGQRWVPSTESEQE